MAAGGCKWSVSLTIVVVSWPAKRKVLIWSTVLQTRDALGVTSVMANRAMDLVLSRSFGVTVE